MRVAELNGRVVAASSALQVAVAAITPALTTGTWTATQVRNFSATITGIRADLTETRRYLDQVDPAAIAARPDDRVVLWRWERATRQALVLLDKAAAEALVQAAELEGGRQRRLHTVLQGETLQAIAQVELGDWAAWPKIATANGLRPGVLSPGTVLIIPDT